MTLKSDGSKFTVQGGVAWTETKPVTLQYGDPIETDNNGCTDRIQLERKTLNGVKQNLFMYDYEFSL